MNFKKYKLDFKGRPQRSPKTISNYNLFHRFQPWCWTAIQKLNSKDQVFLKRCYAKESSNLIAQVNCGAQAFLWKRVGGSPPSSSVKKKTSHICTKTDNLWPWKFPACRKYSLSATRVLEIPPSCNVVGEVSLLTRPQWKTLRFRLYSTGNQVDPCPYEKNLAS